MDGKVFEQVTCPGNCEDELVKSELAQSKNVCTANCVILMKHIPIPPPPFKCSPAIVSFYINNRGS